MFYSRSFNAMLLPRASLKTFQRTITTALTGVQEQSVVAAASRRFKNPKTQSAYDSLLTVLDSEKLKGDVIPPSPSVSVLNVSTVDRTLTYIWDYFSERVLVTAYVPDDVSSNYFIGLENTPAVQLVVCNFKENGFRLGFGVRAFDFKLVIDHVSFASKERARGQHVFDFSKDFDGSTQAAWYNYLGVRNIEVYPWFQKTDLLRSYSSEKRTYY